MKPYKVFVISLAGSLERRRFITKQLDSLQLDYTIFDAIDGNVLPQNEYDLLVDAVAIAPKLKWLTKGAVGCALSHLAVYGLIAKEEIPFALVLEDDCILNKELPQLLDSLTNAVEGNDDIILFYFSSGQPIQLKQVPDKELPGKFQIYDVVEPNKLASAVAYVISKKASKRLADFAVPIKTSADHWGYFLDQNIIQKIRCIYPMPVNTSDFKSSIDYLAKDSLLGKLSAFIDKYKLFPAFQFLKFRRRRTQRRLQNIKVVD